MIKLTYWSLPWLLLILVGCSEKSSETPVNAPEPVTAMAEPAIGGKQKVVIGIEACDQFLEKYRACFTRLPEGIQKKMKNGLKKTEKTWLSESKNPDNAKKLAAACQELDKSTSDAMKAQGCNWH